MLNSLQLPVKKRITFLLLSFLIVILPFIPCASGFEYGISPSELNFNGKMGEKICKNVRVFTSIDEISISVEDKWVLESNAEKNINYYLNNSSDLNIALDYERNFTLKKEKEIIICLESKDSGKFKGVLIFQALDGSLNLGIWLNVDILESKKANNLSDIDVNDIANYGKINLVKIFLPMTLFNISLLLALLFVYSKKKKD